MSETRVHNYEAFVLFPQSAAADLQGCVDHVTEIIANRKAELLSIAKWDERRLAYDIRSNKRGLYLLAYFRCDTKLVNQVERDFTLSERILRALVTRCEHLTEEQMRNAEAMQRTQDEARLRRDPVATAPEGVTTEETTSA
ncbi:MAG: 30S ribosomal protein S6 [Phycisphaeraceae bacterium]|nr:30S ribosomal protein S6 [Phycisphaeraceae bacterium]